MVRSTATPEQLYQAYQEAQAEISRLHAIIKLKDEQIRLLNLEKWGPKADKLSKHQLALLPLELVVIAPEVEREAELPEDKKKVPAAKKPRPNHPGRAPLPPHLEHRETIIACPPEECRCGLCGAERPVIGYEVRKELDCKPAEFFVHVIKREKRGSHCQPEQGVAVAPAPQQIVPKSKLSNTLIVEMLAAKFQRHQPVYRLCAGLWEDHGIELSRQTLNEAILCAGSLLMAVSRAMARELLAGDYIQADETTVPCQAPKKTGKNHRAYLWEYSRPGGLVVFQFEMGRGRAGPEKFLTGFRGILQCDGYPGYDQLGPGILYLACMAHIRRGFVEAAKLAPEDPLPAELTAQIDRLYQIEREAKAKGLGAQERRSLRQAESRPIMASLRARITEVRQQIMPGSKLAKACEYAMGQWTRMELYLEHGRTEIDNNWCEGAMRPIALGRKNWLHVGDPSAGPKIAAIASVVETCRRLEIPLRAYLADILPKLGDWPAHRASELTPQAWKSAKTANLP
jgi:transposase